MAKFEIKNKATAKKIIDAVLVIGIFALCAVTIIATAPSAQKEDKAVNTNVESKEEISTDESFSDNRVDNSAQTNETASAEFENNTPSPEISAVTDTNNDLPPEFIKPLNGIATKKFSIDELVYNPTMDDWRIHSGIDIPASTGTAVVAAEGGVVEFSGFHTSLGFTVIVTNGTYKCIYSSLESDLMLNQGQNISKGEVIGHVGESMISEVCDEPHLHFEMKINDEYVNPEEYIIFE